jgi:hypothetical protein
MMNGPKQPFPGLPRILEEKNSNPTFEEVVLRIRQLLDDLENYPDKDIVEHHRANAENFVDQYIKEEDLEARRKLCQFLERTARSLELLVEKSSKK